MSDAISLPLPVEELRGIFRSRGVLRAHLFGSYARGQQTAASDVDLLIEPGPELGLLDILALEAELEALTGVRFELATQIRESFRCYIEPELVDLEL